MIDVLIDIKECRRCKDPMVTMVSYKVNDELFVVVDCKRYWDCMAKKEKKNRLNTSAED